jgi:hypothetical protein
VCQLQKRAVEMLRRALSLPANDTRAAALNAA